MAFIAILFLAASGVPIQEDTLEQARELAASSQADAAIAILSQEVLGGSASREHYLLLAKLQEDTDTAESAIETLRDVSNRYPEDDLIQLELGNALYRNGELQAAVEVFRRLSARLEARDEKEQLAHVLYLQGQAYLAGQNYFGSLVAAQKAVRAHERAEYYSLLGSASFNLSQNTDAAEAFAKAIELEPESPLHFFNLGLVRLRLRDLNGAEESLKQAVALDPSFGKGFYYLGQIHTAKQQHLDAIKYFKMAEELGPNVPGFYYQMGLAYKRLGQNSQAVEVLLKEVQLDPDSASVRVELGLALTRTRQWKKAREHLEKALELNPKVPVAKFLLGKALSELDEPQLALEYLNAAILEEPTAKEPHFLLARIYWRLGDDEKAQEEIETYRQKNRIEKPVLVSGSEGP